MIAVCYIAVLF